MKHNDRFDAYVNLCLKLRMAHDTDRKSVKIHNDAVTELEELGKDILNSGETDLFYQLMDHDDVRVSLYSAAFCLRWELLYEKAINTVKHIADFCKDAEHSFSAKELIWRYERFVRNAAFSGEESKWFDLIFRYNFPNKNYYLNQINTIGVQNIVRDFCPSRIRFVFSDRSTDQQSKEELLAAIYVSTRHGAHTYIVLYRTNDKLCKFEIFNIEKSEIDREMLKNCETMPYRFAPNYQNKLLSCNELGIDPEKCSFWFVDSNSSGQEFDILISDNIVYYILIYDSDRLAYKLLDLSEDTSINRAFFKREYGWNYD